MHGEIVFDNALIGDEGLGKGMQLIYGELWD